MFEKYILEISWGLSLALWANHLSLQNHSCANNCTHVELLSYSWVFIWYCSNSRSCGLSEIFLEDFITRWTMETPEHWKQDLLKVFCSYCPCWYPNSIHISHSNRKAPIIFLYTFLHTLIFFSAVSDLINFCTCGEVPSLALASGCLKFGQDLTVRLSGIFSWFLFQIDCFMHFFNHSKKLNKSQVLCSALLFKE